MALRLVPALEDLYRHYGAASTDLALQTKLQQQCAESFIDLHGP
jgi:hypothetical protein